MAQPVINEPCPEKWDAMIPESGGHFCDKCCKVVIDFTQKTTKEILEYLSLNTDVCGRLKTVPVRASAPASQKLKLFTAALYLVFGSILFTACGSSDDSTVGKVVPDSATQAQIRYSDSIANIPKTPPKTDSSKSTDIPVIDSAGMMDALHAIDSIAKLKEK